MNLNKYEVSSILNAYTLAKVLTGVCYPQFPNSYFPKGRMKLAFSQALKIQKHLEKIVARPDFEDHCAKLRRKAN